MAFTITFMEVFLWSVYLIAPLLATLSALTVVLSLIVARIERWGTLDALYWGFITATTVGYGDIRPLKTSSKMLSVAIALVGIMFTGILVALTVRSASLAFDTYLRADADALLKRIVP